MTSDEYRAWRRRDLIQTILAVVAIVCAVSILILQGGCMPD